MATVVNGGRRFRPAARPPDSPQARTCNQLTKLKKRTFLFG